MQYFHEGETMKKREVIDIIDKHIALNKREVMAEKMKHELTGSDEALEMFHAHAGGVTALKMLKMEINGEREYERL